MAIAIGHGQISPSPATLTPLFELESTSVGNEVPVKKSPHLLLGLNLSSRSPQVDPTESFDVWTVALQDGPDVHTALSYAMHAPEQRYERNTCVYIIIPGRSRKPARQVSIVNVAIFCALIERPHCDVFQIGHLHMELEVAGAAHMKPLDMCVEEQPLGGPLEDTHGHHRQLRYPDKWQNLLQLAKCGRSGDDDGQRLQARTSNVLQNGRQVQIINKDFQASQLPAQPLAKLK